MPVPPQLYTQLLKLSVCLRELATEGLKEVEEMLRLDAACSQELQCTTLSAHHKLSFEGGTLVDNIIPRKQLIDSFAVSSCKGQHLGHRRKSAFLFKGRESGVEGAE